MCEIKNIKADGSTPSSGIVVLVLRFEISVPRIIQRKISRYLKCWSYTPSICILILFYALLQICERATINFVMSTRLFARAEDSAPVGRIFKKLDI
jgi:hypothetical protein